MIKESLRRNHENFLLDYETSLIIDCVSPFAYAFDKFKGQKSLDEFVQKQKFYVAPKQINIGFDEVSQKEDSILYVPLLSTLYVILQHEDVLSEVLADTVIIITFVISLNLLRMVLAIKKTNFLALIKIQCKFVFIMMILILSILWVIKHKSTKYQHSIL